MKRLPAATMLISLATILIMSVPANAHAQEGEPQAGPASPPSPPIAQQLVREGDFAIKLQTALGLGTSEDEVEAESTLGNAGIAPRNGWIADYPVTPDIVGELRKSVGDAAEAGTIDVDRDEALKKLDTVSSGFSLAVKPHVARTNEPPPEGTDKYPDSTVINNYYYDQGPPVVTYYAPPPDYYYLYSWVAYPFWCYGFWFPGFFILHDFHRTVFVGHRVAFVSNHFNDIRRHRVFRIDPVTRFNGRTFAGIGVSNRRGFISTGVPRGDRRIFNRSHRWGESGGRMTSPPISRGGRTFGQPPRGGRSFAPSPRGGRMYGTPSGGGRMGAPPATGGGYQRRGMGR
ncbi:MAG TPA: hypothetical protein VI389_09020 [Geobacteraceae bacterium]